MKPELPLIDSLVMQKLNDRRGVESSKTRFLRHVPALDGVRAIAIVIVIALHVHIFKGGFIGVDIFFVLSGFLITSLLMKEIAATGSINFRVFLIKRCLRLLPALCLCILCYLIYEGLNGRFELAWKAALVALTYTMNYMSVFSSVNGDLLSHTWSLSVEAQFYLIWPFICLMMVRYCNDRTIFYVCLVSIFICMSWRSYLTLVYGSLSIDRTYRCLDTRADSLLVGCLLAFMIVQNRIVFKAALLYLCAGFLIFIILLVPPGHLWLHGPGLTFVAFASAYIIGFIVRNPETMLSRILSLWPVTLVGEISYGLYLFHYPIIQLSRASNIKGIDLVAIPISAGLAFLSYKFYEKRFLKLKSSAPVIARSRISLNDSISRETVN